MKLNVKKTIYVGFAFLIIQLFWQVYDSVIAKMLIDSFGLSQTASGFVMALDNIIAIILLPVFGALSDKTKTKRGKRTPYIFFGTICAAILLTGVSLFDNAQNAKIEQANIGDIETIEVTEELINKGTMVLDENFKTRLLTKEDEEFFTFEYKGAILNYIEKEDAVLQRTEYVSEIRKQNVGFYIGFIIILFLVLLSMATFRTPAVSLMPDVTPKPLRSNANAIINLMGSAGGIISLIIMMFLSHEYQSYTPLFIVIGTLMLLGLAFFLWKVNEVALNKEMEELQDKYGINDSDTLSDPETGKMSMDVLKSFILILLAVAFWYMAYNAATSKFSVYATSVLNTGYSMPLLVAQGAAIITYLPIGALARKIGRKKTILIGVAILFSAFFLAIFVTSKTALLIWVAMALAGIGWATINVNSYPMVVEMSKGNDVGKYTGIYYTASMSAQIITPVLSGVFMDMPALGYNALFPYCSIFAALAFIAMLFVRHGDSKPISKDKLEAFASMDD